FNAGRSIWLPGWLNAINENSNSLFLTIGPGDFLVHHSKSLGLHTTTVILVKGALDALCFKLMPEKKDFGYSFPCDGPGRGGTCDISAWDAFYLVVFWILNTIGWFNESSTYLMGWLRDYLWLNSSQHINRYKPFEMNSLSVSAWMLLFGHLELIETLAWAHERTPLANSIRWWLFPLFKQDWLGYIFTYVAFLIASTPGKFEGEEEAIIGTKISFNLGILKKKEIRKV
ncbi:hypothetical protein F8388_008656, partial [Cannabis sativa]